jgi:hypothetical protein
MSESTDSNSKMLEMPVGGPDPIFTMSRAVDAGTLSFRGVIPKEGGYYFSLGKDADINYDHQIDVILYNRRGDNFTNNTYVTINRVPTSFTYKMEFTATEQLHYINDILVYTSTISIEPVNGSNHYPGGYDYTMYIDNLAFLDSAGVTLLPGGVDMLNMEPYTIGEAAINTTLVTEYGMIGWGGDNAYLNGISIVANPIPSTSELLTGNWKCTRLSVSSEAGVRESEVFSTTDVTPPGINADMFLNIAANNSGHMTRIYNTAILNETDTFDDDALFGSGVDRKPDDYTTILDGPTYRATPVSTNGSTEITLNGTTMNPAYLVYYAVSNNSINYGVPDESMNDRTYQIIELTDTTMTLSIGFETSTGVQNYWNATYNKDSTSYPLYLRILAFESYAELLADGVTPAEIRALGLSISQLNDMGANFKELEYLDIQELISSGVSIGTLVLYFTLAELKAEFTLADLKQEFTLAELIEVGFTLAELKLEFALAELKLEFALAELLAEFELAELKAESYKLTSEIVGESDSSYGYVEANTDGTTYVIANNGLRRIEVYHKVGTQWSLKGTPISYLSEESNGYGVDINSDGTIISFGEIYAPQGGYMSVYQYSDNLQDWEQLGSTIRALPPDTTGEGFGYRTRLSYNGLIVAGSSPFQSSSNLELVVVYKYSDVSHEWEQLGQTILSEDPDNFGYGQNDHGYSLDISADGLTLVIGARLAEAQLGNARIYAYNEDSSLWEQKGDTIGSFNQKLSPGAPLSAEHLSMDASGLTIAIADRYDAGSAGVTRIFQYDDVSSTWTQLGQDINGEAAGDRSGWFGIKLSADGSTVAIGAPFNDGNGTNSGHIRVYQNESGTWTQISQDIDGAKADDLFGATMTMSASGTTLFAVNSSNAGTLVNIYDRTPLFTLAELKLEFTLAELKLEFELAELKLEFELAELKLEFELADFKAAGYTVAELKAGGFTLAELKELFTLRELYDAGFTIAELLALGGDINFVQLGQDIDGEAAYDYSVAVSTSADGSIVAFGAGRNDGNGRYSGHVRVYKNESGTWTQIGQDIDGEAADDRSGHSLSVSADGSIVAIGARYNDGNGSNSGHVRVYKNESGTWTQIGQDIDGEGAGDNSGWSVSLSNDGSIVAIGAIYNDGNGFNSGHVRVYKNESGTWTQIGQDIDGEAAGDQSGTSVSLSADGSIVAIGARYNAGVNGSYSGHVRVYQKVVIGVTIADLIAAGFTAADFKAAGYTLAELIAAGFTLAELKLEFELAELKLEFELAELKLEFELAELKLEFELAELIAGGFTLAELKLEFELAELMLLELFVLADFKAAGFTLAELKAGGFTLAELKELFTLRELYDTGFTIADLLALGGDINFVQLGQDIDGEAAYDYSGGSVSLSANGSIVAIGANGSDGNGTLSGHVRVYQNVSGTWTQIGEDIDGEAIYDWSGYSVSLSADGSIVAIGAIGNAGDGSYSGHVRVYQNESGTWTQIGQDIDGEAANDRSGNTVSLSADGSIVAIGAPYNDGNGNDSGHVRVYKNKSGIWTPIGQGIFQDIDGEAAGDQSGVSVSLSADGSIVAIGAYYNDGNGNNSGHVRVYQYRIVPINVGPGSTIYTEVWTQIGQDIDGEAAGDWSGVSVSLSNDGSIVAIGANYNNANGLNSGHVRVYQNESGTWTQIGQDIDGEAEFDYSGRSVSLSADGSIVAIGAYRNDGNGTDSGHVRVYQNESGTWTQIGQDIDGEAAGDESGATVSLSADGSIVAIGAYGNDGNGTNSGHVRVYQKVDTTITIAVLIAAGFTLAELKLEFELAELKLEFELAELKLEFELAELKLEFELAELIAGGFTLAELKLEFELAELMLLELFVLADFKAAGYTVAELKAGGFTIVELLAVGFTDLEIARGGFTATQMFEADINPLVFKNDVPTSEFRDFGYTCKIARLVYPIANVVSAYTSIELKDAGVNIETLVNYKKPLADIKTAYSDITTTYTPVQLKPIYTIREMSSIYSITELTDAFTLLQMNNEYSLPELLELGAYDFEQMDLDFTFPELRGKFTLRELNTVFSLVKLHTELSFKVLNGEFTLRELNKSFTLKELHTEFTLARINESFTLVEMNAEFTLKELREAFSYNQLRNEFTALELAEGNVYD